MVSAANAALDFRILQIRLLLLILALLFLCIRFPVRYRPEYDVLGDGGGVCLWAEGFAFLLPKLRPLLSLGHARVDDLLHDGFLYAPGSLDALSIFANGVCDDGFGTVLVLGDCG